MGSANPTTRKRVSDMLQRGLCVACISQAMQSSGRYIEEAIIRQIAQETSGASQGHCIRCSAPRSIVRSS